MAARGHEPRRHDIGTLAAFLVRIGATAADEGPLRGYRPETCPDDLPEQGPSHSNVHEHSDTWKDCRAPEAHIGVFIQARDRPAHFKVRWYTAPPLDGKDTGYWLDPKQTYGPVDETAGVHGYLSVRIGKWWVRL